MPRKSYKPREAKKETDVTCALYMHCRFDMSDVTLGSNAAMEVALEKALPKDVMRNLTRNVLCIIPISALA